MYVCLGLLPVRGVIPDMTSDSDKYIQLHCLYREQAAVDVVAVTTHLLRLLQTIGRVTIEQSQSIEPPLFHPVTVTRAHSQWFLSRVSILLLTRDIDILSVRLSVCP